jgi:hypothetical protein
MRKWVGFLAVMCGFFWISAAHATVHIDIDLTTQTMNVASADGSYTWRISSARSGYVTPRGTFKPYALQRMHYSKKYHMSPMPYSIFFAGGYAIHGTYSVSQLGRPASHGCIRLSPQNAATLYRLVQSEGAAISISGSPPHRAVAVAAHHKKIAHPHALAYAPVHHPAAATVVNWQYNPMSR